MRFTSPKTRFSYLNYIGNQCVCQQEKRRKILFSFDSIGTLFAGESRESAYATRGHQIARIGRCWLRDILRGYSVQWAYKRYRH